MNQKRLPTLLISGIIGSIYLSILTLGLMGLALILIEKGEPGASLAILFAMPHYLLILAAIILNWISYALNKKTLALIAAILYAVGAFIARPNFIYIIGSVVLSFIGYNQLRTRQIEANNSIL